MFVFNRLLLLGGFNAILEQMKSDGVPPSIKTFTILLDVMPGTDVAEEVRTTVKTESVCSFFNSFCSILAVVKRNEKQ